jgi:hypothetical protein
MDAAYASDLDELKNWVEGVRQLPRFLRTKDAGALFDALAAVGVARGADLDGASVDDVATRLGRERDALMAALRRCPFGL